MFEFIKNRLVELNIDFMRPFRYVGAVSAILVLASWIGFVVVGPNWGIDFTGGTEIHIRFHDDTGIADVRAALVQLGLSDDTVQQVNDPDDHEFTIRIQDTTFGSAEMREEVETRLGTAFGEDWIESTLFDAEVGARMSIYYKGDAVVPQKVGEVLADMEGVVVRQGRDQNQIIVNMPGLAQQIEEEIREVMGEHSFEVLEIDAVGPKVGGELRRQGFISVVATLALVLVYVAFRFDVGFAPGAVLALLHDVSLTAGVFVLLQKEFNLPMIGALLTIVGYSLNDTIVIYDRIRENSDRYRRKELRELINVSINETLARTLATSVTTLLAISAFLVMGGPVIQTFAFAMMLGIIFGTYSTVFVASPTILVMERVKPRLATLIAGGAKPTEETTSEGPLTQAEKRRRERAARDKEAPTL
jgi:preprotein translocase subunit SecF